MVKAFGGIVAFRADNSNFDDSYANLGADSSQSAIVALDSRLDSKDVRDRYFAAPIKGVYDLVPNNLVEGDRYILRTEPGVIKVVGGADEEFPDGAIASFIGEARQAYRVDDSIKISSFINSIMLEESTTFYVDRSWGSDSNNGLNADAAFQTIGKALSTLSVIHCGGKPVTIDIASGNYTLEGILHLPPVTGAVPETCLIGEGYPSSNPKSPVSNAQVRIIGSTDNSVSVAGFEIDQPGYYSIENLTIEVPQRTAARFEEGYNEVPPSIVSKRGGRLKLINAVFNFSNDFFTSPIRAEYGGCIELIDKISFLTSRDRITNFGGYFSLDNRGVIVAEECEMVLGKLVTDRFATIQSDSLLNLSKLTFDTGESLGFTRKFYAITLCRSRLILPINSHQSNVYFFGNSTGGFINDTLVVSGSSISSFIGLDSSPFLIGKGSLDSPSTAQWASSSEIKTVFNLVYADIEQLKNRDRTFTSNPLSYINNTNLVFPHEFREFDSVNDFYQIQVRAVCTSPENGWTIGERIKITSGYTESIDATNIYVQISNTGARAYKKDGKSTDFDLTPSNWQIYVTAVSRKN